MPELAAWESFYVITGGAAGALIGLQFVVLTLIADRPSMRIADAGAAFITPTIVHFSAVLLLSALIRVPWHDIQTAAIFWGAVGVAGVIYIGIVLRRMHAQKAYKPDLEDHMYYVVLPFIGYAALIAAAVMAGAHEHEALYAIAAASLIVMFTAIHNAWDGISYHVYVVRPKQDAKDGKTSTQD